TDRESLPAGSDLVNVGGLESLRTASHFELDRLPLRQRLESVALDRGEVHEHVLAALLRDESKTLGVVEPLHGATCHGTAPYFRARGRPTYRPTRRLRSGHGDRWTRTMRSPFEVPAWRGSPPHPFEPRRPSRMTT